MCCVDITYLYVQGVRNLKETDLNPLYVLIKPPSMDVLEKRLRDRMTESEESLMKRLDVAREELAFGERTLVLSVYSVSMEALIKLL